MKQLMTITDLVEITLQNKPNFEADAHKDNIVAKNAFVCAFRISPPIVEYSLSNYFLSSH